MTIAGSNSRNDYVVSGGNCVFQYTFKINDAANMSVYLCSALQSTGYSVSGAGNDSGGSVTFTSVPANGSAVALVRNEPYTQTLDLQEHGVVSLEAIEDRFDTDVMLIQQVKELTDRSITFAASSCLTGITVDDITGCAGMVLSVATDEQHLEWVSVSQAQSAATGSFTPSDSGAVTRTVSSKLADILSVKDFGAVGNGTTDDTAAFQAAIAASSGTILVPTGDYRITSTLTVAQAVTLLGVGAAPGNQDNGTAAIIRHDFNGTLFAFVGTNGNNDTGSGGGLENLLLLQVSGSGTSNAGTAVCVKATSQTFNASRVRLHNLQIETTSSSVDSWDYAVILDGDGAATNGVHDVWLTNSRLVGDTNSRGAVWIKNGRNIHLTDLQLTGDNANVCVTGTAAASSSSVFLTSVSGDALVMDFACHTYVTGGAWTAVQPSANTKNYTIQVGSIDTVPTMAGTAGLVSARFETQCVWQQHSTNNEILFSCATFSMLKAPVLASNCTPSTCNVYAQSQAKAWVVFDGTNLAGLVMPSVSFNISGKSCGDTAVVTKRATGDYCVSFLRHFSCDRYAVSITAGGGSGNVYGRIGNEVRGGCLRFHAHDENGTLVDPPIVSAVFFGLQ